MQYSSLKLALVNMEVLYRSSMIQYISRSSKLTEVSCVHNGRYDKTNGVYQSRLLYTRHAALDYVEV